MVQEGGLAGIGQRRLAMTLGALSLAAGLAIALLALADAALLFGGVAVALVVLIWPAASLALLALAIPFGNIRTLSVGGVALGGVEVVTALVVIAWVADGVRRRHLTLNPGPLLWPLVLLIAAFSLSIWDAISIPASLAEMAKWAEVAVVYIIGCSLLTAPRRAHLLVGAVLAAGLAESAVGIYGAVMRLGPPSYAILGGQLYRASGDFAQPNPFAGYVNHVWPLALALLVTALISARAGSDADLIEGESSVTAGHVPRWLGALALVTTLVALSALIASWSRGAWLGAALAAVAMVVVWSAALLRSRRPKDRIAGRRAVTFVTVAASLALAVGMLGAADLLPASIAGRLTSIGDDVIVQQDLSTVKVTDANFATVERMAHWWAGLRMWEDYPWTGVGLGNYAEAYDAYKVAGWDDPLGHAHNFYINVGAEAGTIGLAAYLVFLAWAAALAVRRSLQAGNAWDRALAVAVVGVLVARVTQDALDNLWVHGMGVQVALLLVLLQPRQGSGASRSAEQRVAPPP